MLGCKILFWYLLLGGLFIFAMADKIDLIIAALKMKYDGDERKQLSETGWRKFIMVIFLILWPVFVINILRKMGNDGNN